MSPCSPNRRSLAAFRMTVMAVSACPSRAKSRLGVPQERRFVVTAIPLLAKEMVSTDSFAREDFAPGGVLEGKEIYAFVPSTLTVVEGDTVRFTLVNPEDDQHDFILPGLVLQLPGQSATEGSWRAEHAGIVSFVCTIPAHMPEMVGRIVVLPAAVGAGFTDPAALAGRP